MSRVFMKTAAKAAVFYMMRACGAGRCAGAKLDRFWKTAASASLRRCFLETVEKQSFSNSLSFETTVSNEIPIQKGAKTAPF